jgi:hypothetical protein
MDKDNVKRSHEINVQVIHVGQQYAWVRFRIVV